MHAAHRQLPFTVRLEWGLRGAQAVLPGAGAAVVVDTLSFSTAVSVGVEAGLAVLPFRAAPGDGELHDAAARLAEERGALLAAPRSLSRLSLSPSSIRAHAVAHAGRELVLPSPNGSAISEHLAGRVPDLLAGTLRNAGATAAWLGRHVPPSAVVVVVAAGERWPGGALRPAVEDQLGAGAVLAALLRSAPGRTREQLSPEARAAVAVFEAFREELPTELAESASGSELVLRGFGSDVDLAAELDASSVAARFSDGAFRPT
ncbi:phosphosulfolactate phosphohydrolase [Arthrobacter woluwensis]|uniref:2-phosphosulfolactate phosphatase n=1 Tax=Arthrobacter woluwensis TaxID=156980 RepID=UPI000D1260D0|nr:2-phosphosulfolactate phosphatase [Arthrobacter woluwensis]PSS43070.1 phosphosulfolactate phosphohydrolase [Arthrobacter woluwensis]